MARERSRSPRRRPGVGGAMMQALVDDARMMVHEIDNLPYPENFTLTLMNHLGHFGHMVHALCKVVKNQDLDLMATQREVEVLRGRVFALEIRNANPEAARADSVEEAPLDVTVPVRTGHQDYSPGAKTLSLTDGTEAES